MFWCNVKTFAKKKIESHWKQLLYSKKKVKLPDDEDRLDKQTNDANADNRTDDNIDERIQKFQNQLKNVYCYRIPLKYICNLGLVNTSIKFNTKWRLTFERNMQKLFKKKTNQAADGLLNTVDAKIIIDSTLYLLYYQFDSDDVYRTYFKSAMISENLFRTGIRKTPLQENYELVAGPQSKTITFNNKFKQFSFLEISLVFDRSDHHLSIYDSYNSEVAVTKIKAIKLQIASNTYSKFNTVKFDLEDQEYWCTLYNAFVVWVTNSSSIVSESDFMYNETRQELPNRNMYFTDSDERVYIDIRQSKGYTGEFERVNRDDRNLNITINLKAAATKDGLIMNYKEYGVNKQKTVTAS